MAVKTKRERVVTSASVRLCKCPIIGYIRTGDNSKRYLINCGGWSTTPVYPLMLPSLQENCRFWLGLDRRYISYESYKNGQFEDTVSYGTRPWNKWVRHSNPSRLFVCSQIVTCATDKNLSMWDVQVGERVRKYRGHQTFVNTCDVARRGPQLLCSGSDDGTLRVCSTSPIPACLHVDHYGSL